VDPEQSTSSSADLYAFGRDVGCASSESVDSAGELGLSNSDEGRMDGNIGSIGVVMDFEECESEVMVRPSRIRTLTPGSTDSDSDGGFVPPRSSAFLGAAPSDEVLIGGTERISVTSLEFRRDCRGLASSTCTVGSNVSVAEDTDLDLFQDASEGLHPLDGRSSQESLAEVLFLGDDIRIRLDRNRRWVRVLWPGLERERLYLLETVDDVMENNLESGYFEVQGRVSSLDGGFVQSSSPPSSTRR